MHLRPLGAECRIAHARILRHDAAAEYSQGHRHLNLDSHPACALVAGHVRSVAVKDEKPVVQSIPVPRLGWFPVVHRVCLLDSAAQLEALLSIRVVHRACLCLVQTVKVRFLPELVVRPPRVFLAGQVKPAPSPLAQRMNSRQQPPGCLLFVQQHALAEEYSSGSRF
jgi:hypothetical protein